MMIDPQSPGIGDPSSEDELCRCFEALRNCVGPCPDLQLLERFLKHDLSDEEYNKIENHVDLCGVCDCLIERMKEFDAAFEAGGRAARANRGFASAAFGLLRHPAFAYGIALLMIYPAYLGLSGKWQTPYNSPAAKQSAPPPRSALEFDSAQVLQLDATRGAEVQPGLLPAHDKHLILSFLVPIRPGFRYSADIADGAGRIIASKPEIFSYDGKGDFQLVCERGLFAKGEYVLTVSEMDPRSNNLVRRFPFSFALN